MTATTCGPALGMGQDETTIPSIANDVSEKCPTEDPYLIGVHGTMGHGTSPNLPNYVSWRFTTPYQTRVEKALDGSTYIACHEVSKKGVEHYHVVSIGHDDYDRVRKRIQRMTELDGKKNWTWSSKNHNDDLRKALAYTLKTRDNDGNKRWWQTEKFPEIKYEPWVYSIQTTIPTEEDRSSAKARKESDWQLTYANIVCQAVKYHQSKGLPVEVGFRETITHMMDNTKWRPSIQVYRGGLPYCLDNDFEIRVGKRVKRDSSWMIPRDR